jgi:betaine lipid synthase
MGENVDVPSFFSAVYLVDLSPSLCNVARKRFSRLGWKNVSVVCCDARLFDLDKEKADLVTMSYSLSMMPNFHVIIDSASHMLDVKHGIIGVVDFYVQSVVETSGRNYIGSSLQRHVNWLGRTFWRAWFDLDRVGLEGARRASCQPPPLRKCGGPWPLPRQDYLEYRFGTLKAVDDRNYILGGHLGICIPYYIFVGRPIAFPGAYLLERSDTTFADSPYLFPQPSGEDNAFLEVRSNKLDSAIVNLTPRLPLPSAFYQNRHYRILYDENLPKHTQFNNDFLYAFTWECSQTDLRLLKMTSEDTILCITSAGDNLLDYIYSSRPKRVHAVDLNPNQNHLLELKIAAYQALPYLDFWKLFGEGRHPGFRDLLIKKLSPYLSSHAFQYWMNRKGIFTSPRGLYEHGGSGRAIRLSRLLLRACGLSESVKQFCNAKTLNEQRELWPRIRRVLMSRFFHWAFLGSQFWWEAGGVPPAQVAMIYNDYLEQESLNPFQVGLLGSSAEAMWQFLQNTFDPVVKETLVSEDNFYYLLTLMGHYTRR